jgi:hypothetical protein
VDDSLLDVLDRSGSLVFPPNRASLREVAAGGRVRRLPTGHLVFYGPHGRRILATDPGGTPLHECEWTPDGRGGARLARARLHLDWGQWVGLTPGGLVNETVLDLSRKPGWRALRADDLRGMAARALRVPIEEVRCFYGDEDLVLDGAGHATIRHRKDAFFILEDGTFERARFMACMGAMHWERIDFLPVVELFRSLLPGTGSAAFELIRGLYDDQNRDGRLPLRYRGIPTYPSEAAYKLFGAFFAPSHPSGEPFPVFMDPPRSQEVTWLPVPDPPRRYFDRERRLCVTIQGATVQKATPADDPAGLAFVRPRPDGFAPCGRSVTVSHGKLILRDGETATEVPVDPAWGPIADSPATALAGTGAARGEGWLALFRDAPPRVTAAQAWSSVLLYPLDDREIDEPAAQPFVADFLQDEMEQDRDLAARASRAGRILALRFEAALEALIALDRPAAVTLLYEHPALAQRQAQALWNRLAQAGKLDWTGRFSFLPAVSEPAVLGERYDLIYAWTPYALFDRSDALGRTAAALAGALAPGGMVFAVGPAHLGALLRARGLRLVREAPVESLPTFRMHRSILPKARLTEGLTLFLAAGR